MSRKERSAASVPGGNEQERVGTVVAEKYRLEASLAAGGMGCVYRAHHLRLGRDVALKLLHPDHVSKEEYVKRFQKEARKVASLEHPGIVEVRDFGWDEAVGPYLEMELLEGASVDQLIAAHGPLPVDVVVRVACEALDALTAAHARKIVHRDLKPQNLFVSIGPDADIRVKVLDFGIAKLFATDPSEDSTYTETLTKTGVVLGTLNYMSPEQFVDSRAVDHRADLYSVGATLYEMLTDRPVVEGHTVFECISQVTNGTIDRHPRELRADVPEALDAAVARALSRSPEQRQASAAELRLAIETDAAMGRETRESMRRLAEEARTRGGRRAATDALTRADATIPVHPERAESGPLVVVAGVDSSERTTIDEEAGGARVADARKISVRPPPMGALAHRDPNSSITPNPVSAGVRPRRRPGKGAFAFAVAAILIGGAATAFVTNRRPEPTTPAAQPPTAAPVRDEPPAGALPAPPATGESAAEEAVPEVTVPEEEAPEEPAVSEEPATTRRQRHEASRRDPGERRRAAAPRAGGRVDINTIPTARIFIDGADTGRSTPVSGLPVEPGRHRLELRLPDGSSHAYPIEVRAGETTRVFRVLPQ